MAENSNIEWCDHTFNPWTGCTKVSPGCANCYAEGWSKRSGIVTWGKGQPRKRTSEANWKLPLKWNREADLEWQTYTSAVAAGAGWPGEAPRRPRVFCASLADWLDDEVPPQWLSDLLHLIRITPHLDWLLLTKRPQNFQSRLFQAWHDVNPADSYTYDWIKSWERGTPYETDHIWIGTTVEDQKRADERIPYLLDIPARIHFLSCEPLLGFTDIQQVGDDDLTIYWPLVGKAISDGMNEPHSLKNGRIDWVICGGESGPGARPMHPDWPRALRDMCQQAGVPFLFKQWGEFAPCDPPVVTNIDGKLQATRSWRASDRYVECPKTGQWVKRVGKKSAGRQLDGRDWNEFPNL
jgi:protein gp37